MPDLDMAHINTQAQTSESMPKAMPKAIAEQDRLQALEALAHIYDARQKQGWSREQISTFLDDCQSCCFWPLIIKLAARNLSQMSVKSLEIVAYAAFQMGYLKLAKTMIRRGLLLAPDSGYLIQLSQDVHNWLHFTRQYQFDECCPDNKEGLYLQLLGHHHIDSYMSIYDQQTASLCCLPAFIDAWDWHQWLDGQYEPGDELTFAVMHADFGMIGSVSLVLQDNTGFFYYWVGSDFRGYGFGPAAVSLLLQTAHQQYGLERCYAKVFEDNQSSRRGLKKLGFTELPIRAAEPYADEVYYCLGDTSDMDVLTEDMYAFYQKIRCWKPFTRPLNTLVGSGVGSGAGFGAGFGVSSGVRGG